MSIFSTNHQIISEQLFSTSSIVNKLKYEVSDTALASNLRAKSSDESFGPEESKANDSGVYVSLVFVIFYCSIGLVRD